MQETIVENALFAASGAMPFAEDIFAALWQPLSKTSWFGGVQKAKDGQHEITLKNGGQVTIKADEIALKGKAGSDLTAIETAIKHAKKAWNGEIGGMSGTETFKAQAWALAQKHGVTVKDYEPTPEALRYLEAHTAKEPAASITRSVAREPEAKPTPQAAAGWKPLPAAEDKPRQLFFALAEKDRAGEVLRQVFAFDSPRQQAHFVEANKDNHKARVTAITTAEALAQAYKINDELAFHTSGNDLLFIKPQQILMDVAETKKNSAASQATKEPADKTEAAKVPPKDAENTKPAEPEVSFAQTEGGLDALTAKQREAATDIYIFFQDNQELPEGETLREFVDRFQQEYQEKLHQKEQDESLKKILQPTTPGGGRVIRPRLPN